MSTDEDWIVVYRSGSAAALDLVEAMLTAEGLQPRRLGRASPALLGAGESAVAQLIEVPAAHAEVARALVAASESADNDPKASAELEDEALRARAALDPGPGAVEGPSIWTVALIAVALFLGYLCLR